MALQDAIVMTMRCGGLYFLILGILLPGCSGPANSARHQEPIPPPEPYVRIANADSNIIQLQIAARQFLPPRPGDPVIWLTGVSHIGESDYYAALQKHLDARTRVLYEGVGAAEGDDAHSDSKSTVSSRGTESTAPSAEQNQNPASLQSAMAASLGLVFQLEAINYRSPNFRNSDLSISQLRQLMSRAETPAGEPSASDSFENLIELMQGSSWFDSLLQLALRFLGANPKFQALGRLALVDLLGQIQGDPSRLGALPPDMKQLLEVLLQRRNEKVVEDLKGELNRVGRHGSIAVFFGTGHMPDLETRLRRELNYRPAQEIWFSAFGVNLAAAKITASEREFIDKFVKWQLAEAGASSSSTN